MSSSDLVFLRQKLILKLTKPFSLPLFRHLVTTKPKERKNLNKTNEHHLNVKQAKSVVNSCDNFFMHVKTFSDNSLLSRMATSSWLPPRCLTPSLARAASSWWKGVQMGPPDAIMGITEVGRRPATPHPAQLFRLLGDCY